MYPPIKTKSLHLNAEKKDIKESGTWMHVSPRKTDGKTTMEQQHRNRALINSLTNKHYLCCLRNSAM